MQETLKLGLCRLQKSRRESDLNICKPIATLNHHHLLPFASNDTQKMCFNDLQF